MKPASRLDRQSMTSRERYFETILFGKPDRIPFRPGAPRESTLKRWRSEGLDPDRNWLDAVCGQIGLKQESSRTSGQPGVVFRMNPMFEEKVLEHKAGHYVVQDWMGNITEISDEFDVTYLRTARDFVTRKWHKFPVETRNDFEEMKKRYDPDDPIRYPSDFDERAKNLALREHATSLAFPGVFWQLREWCGFEPLCMLLVDDPDFVREMASFWSEYVSLAMRRALKARAVDRIYIQEDMAYKEKSMISPAMTREFILPAWERWSREAREAAVRIVEVDSDGRVDELIPIWIEAGVNCCSPMEVAAGNDLNLLRKRFGTKMAFEGGVDKRCMARGGAAIEKELNRLAPVVRDGGYIPGCDHGVPPDISWPDFIRYCGLLAGITGWL